MINLPTDLPRKYRYAYKSTFFAGQWKHDFQLIGAKGGLNLHISGPHNYDGTDRWSACIETHSRTPLYGDDAPTDDECWLLKCPCWHDGSSLYAEKEYLPMFRDGAFDNIFKQMVRDAEARWGLKSEAVES